MRLRALTLLFIIGCTSPSPRSDASAVSVASVSAVPAQPPRPVAAPPAHAGSAGALEAPRTVAKEETPRPIPDEIFLADVPPGGTLRRRDHAIVFLVRTENRWDDKAGNAVERTRLVPIVCATKAGIRTGRECMNGAPEHGVEVRFTGGGTYKVASTVRAVEECWAADNPIGKTDVWQLAKPTKLDRPALAVWPADADVAMLVHRGALLTPTAAEHAQLKLEKTSPMAPGAPRLLQGFEEDLDGDGTKERVFSVFMDGGPRPPLRGEISILRGSSVSVIGHRGADKLVILATLDVAGDKKRQLLVYETWVNDYGFGVYDAQGKKLHGWGCGNV